MRQRTVTYVQPLTHRGRGVPELGGKGDSLARLTVAGFPVPRGFCVTTAAYESFVRHHDLKAAIAARLGDPSAIARLFDDHPIPVEITKAIRTAYADLGEPAVAVRSSATAEDLPEASFAGQQETYLNVRGSDALLVAVRRCWASLWTERAIDYRRRRGIPDDGLSLAVVVQRLVDADAAGILFTADPTTGATETVQINSAWGLGEAVVGGEVTPDTFHVDARTGQVTSRTVADKYTRTVRDGFTGTRGQPVPASRRHQPSLSTAQAEQLAQLGLQIATLYGAPVDMEWCRAGDTLHVLQARPITAGTRQRTPDPWNDSKTTYALWTSTNVGEAVPDVLTPAAWSMVELLLQDAMATSSVPPHIGYGRIGGRVYLNVSVIYTLAGMLGVSERRMRALTSEVLGRIPEDLPVPRLNASRLGTLLPTLAVAVNVQRRARRDMRRLDAYLEAHPALCQQRRAEIQRTRDSAQLAALWRDQILPDFHAVNWMLSAATRSNGFSLVKTRQRLQRLAGDGDANALSAGLGGATGDLASLGLLRGLEDLAAGRIDRDTFNETYGHRGPHELEISHPRPGEDPGWVDDQLAQHRAAPVTSAELLKAQEEARAAAWGRLRRDHPREARTLERRIARWAQIARNREKARSEVVRFFWVLRAYVLRAGELTGLADDIFFLDAEHIANLLQGAETDRQSITAARQTYGSYRTLPIYPTWILGSFDPYTWAADPDRRTDLYSEGVVRGDPTTLIRGFAGSAGVVYGTARVIQDASDGAQLQPGEVLVTTVTNVGWTPLFPRAGAVVTDVGAPLSHAAIVARELGIPAVVGCGNATALLKTGDPIRVDGSAGLVERLTG